MQTLYRAFRPDTFDKVVGQKQVIQILKNQVQQDAVRHAYLFQGTRGTGKTSCAKILARAVNCLHPVDGNPCNTCENCRAIIEESTMDVIEMDAASNRRIDDIRELREKVKYLPSNLKKKVVIIDEAHMITNEAFNALLKTLEEPPDHVLFILATTDMDDIPQTILSRCQIFTFQRISVEDMTKQLAYVVNEVGRTAQTDALEAIAYRADGALRDALSTLEQVLAVTDGDVTLTSVQQATGQTTTEELFAVSKAIQQTDGKAALLSVQALKDQGRESEQLLDDLIEHFRKLMVSRVTDDRRLFSGSDELFTQYQQEAHTWNQSVLVDCLRELIQTKSELRFTEDAYTLVVSSVLTLCQKVQKQALEERIEKLEAYVFSGKMMDAPKQVEQPKPQPVKKPMSIADEVKQEQQAAKPQQPQQETKPVEEETPDPQPTEPTPAEETATEKTPPQEGEMSVSDADWEQILENIRARSMFLHAYLREGSIYGIENGMMTYVFPQGYEIHKNAAEKEDNKTIVKEELERFTGTPMEVRFVMQHEVKPKNVASVESIVEFFGEENVERK